MHKKKKNELNYAIHIQNLIKSLDSNYNIKYWIIDLRENWGGDMYPMIAGLAPIIGEGTYGYFVLPKKERVKSSFKGRNFNEYM